MWCRLRGVAGTGREAAMVPVPGPHPRLPAVAAPTIAAPFAVRQGSSCGVNKFEKFRNTFLSAYQSNRQSKESKNILPT